MSLILGLWSIVLQPGQTFSQTTTPAIQITNISFGAEVKGDARTVVSIKYPEFEQGSDDEDESEDEDEEDDGQIKLPKLITKEAVLAILKPNVTEQVSVNISLVEDVEVVEFSVTGPNAVHVVGHYVRQEDFDQDPYSDEEYGSGDEEIDSDEFDEDDSELEGLSGMIGEDSDEEMDEGRFEELKEELKKNAEKHMSSNLEPNVVLPQTLPVPIPISATTPTDTTSPIPAPQTAPAATADSSSSLSESEPDADSKPATTDVATTDDTSMADVTINVIPAAAPAVDSDVSVTASVGTPPLATATPAPATTPATTSTLAPPTPMTASQKRRERKRRNSGNSKKRVAEVEAEAPSSAAASAADDSTTLSKNQKKKLAKKLKGADGAAAPAPAAVESPKPAEKAAPAPKKEAPKTQTLAGGLIITDAKKGDGPVAKSGKKVGMRYIGKLENGKIFDSNTKGAPLVFTLGRGEVIKGWDQGVAGMAVGGERKLTIPAALAYGKRGTQGIPGNSTLIFDVKLVSLK